MTQIWRGQEWDEQPPKHHAEMIAQRKAVRAEARAIALGELGEDWRRVPSEEEVLKRQALDEAQGV